jgi:hypothetical protein
MPTFAEMKFFKFLFACKKKVFLNHNFILFIFYFHIKLAEMEARVVGAETRAEIAEEKVRFISCLYLRTPTIYRRLVQFNRRGAKGQT